MKKYDLIVLGAGSGGVRVARLAAQQGIKTLIIEGRHWGGTCVNLGCVPKKFMVYASDYARALASSQAYGFAATGDDNNSNSFNWQTLRDKIATETNRLQGIYQKLLKDNAVDMVSGTGYFTAANSIKLAASNEEFSATQILIATGSRPVRPDIPGAELGLISDDLFSLPQLPESLCIVGGGYIALEFANIFATLGSKVSLVHRSSNFLREFDQEVVAFALEEMQQNPNLTILSDTQITAIEKLSDGGLRLNLEHKGNTDQQEVQQLVFAIGRKPNTETLQLDAIAADLLGVKGEIKVDDFYQTKHKGLYALGDVIGRLALTPVAIAEAKKLVAKHFVTDADIEPLDYGAIPKAVFARPELAKIGMSEQQAAKVYQQDNIKVYKISFTPMSEAFKEKKRRFFIKLICSVEEGYNEERIIGVHLAGEGAAEMIQGFAFAYKAKATKQLLDQVVGIHPTIMEEIFTI